MAVQRKVFRIEQMAGVATPATSPAADSSTAPPPPHRDILDELTALRALIERRDGNATAPAETAEWRKLREDTDSIQRAISRTKHELATLHVGAFEGATSNVTRELDAVAEGAERATQNILDAVEDIEDAANTLHACLKREQERALAQDIQDHVVRVLEACNFQDLSGQRITKVIATLKFIEERISHMMAIWGGMDALSPYANAAAIERSQQVTLRGPMLAGEQGHATQDDVDALFAPD
jgi:chemotaxis protein CheZ